MKTLGIAAALVVMVLARSTPALGQMETAHSAQGTTAHGPSTGERADRSAPDLSLGPGQVVGQVLNARGEPAVGSIATLVISHESVAQGTTERVQHRTADAAGIVLFSDLPTGSGYSFRLTVDQAPARYASPVFALGRDHGHRVTIHVFRATSAIEETMVAGQALLYLEPRDDVFQLNVLLELFNGGDTTWVPRGAGFRLPAGWRAFSPEEAGGTVSVQATDTGVELSGSVNPGRHRVMFGFQVPREDAATASIEIGLPPRMAGVRVTVESSPRMAFNVAGFPAAVATVNRQRERVLTTQMESVGANLAPLDRVEMHVEGLATRGSGRWLALALALGVATWGVWAAARPRGGERRDAFDRRDAVKARAMLFSELISLEKAHRAGRIGPETHGQARGVLTEALARLDSTLVKTPASEPTRGAV